MKIKKGDSVIVLRGRDKGKTGKVLAVWPKLGKIQVEGINQATVHRRPKDKKGKGAGVFKEFMPMPASKVGLVNPHKKGRASRIGFRIDSKGIKKRYLKATGKEI